MKIKSVEAFWVHIPIPPERQHTSDFGRTLSFDGTLVRIDTECGLTGWGEAKAQVGGMAQNQALTCMINEEFAPLLKGEDPRDITRLWEMLYSGSRAHYALREGRVFPVLGRRGITISAISGIDCALWDIFGKSLGVPVEALLAGTGIVLTASGSVLTNCHDLSNAVSTRAMILGSRFAVQVTDISTPPAKIFLFVSHAEAWPSSTQVDGATPKYCCTAPQL